MIACNDQGITIEQVVRVARQGEEVAPLSAEARGLMQASHAWVQDSLKNPVQVIYGVNSGFGPLAKVRISNDQAQELSRRVILACATGVGDPLSQDLVRAMLFIRAAQFSRGRSGVRPVVVQTIIDMLNSGVTPWVPAKGSLGASGDLAPLAHIAAVMTREQDPDQGGYSGRAWYQEELMEGAEAMNRAGIDRLVPAPKEGLSLTNGTTFMVAAGSLAVQDAVNLMRQAEVATALSFEALAALSEPLHPALHQASNQPGQIKAAANLRTLLKGSGLIDSDPQRVQDAYCLRCSPQVLGPARDALAFIRRAFSAALNADSDNPLIFMDLPDSSDGKALTGGNFHGQGPAMWLDFLGIAMAELGSIAERRIFRLLTPELNHGLPSMLVPHSGLDTGFMVAQYTAAALVSDNKTLAHPDSVDSIPSSANQEDHVSMGANAARHAREILCNLRHIIAVEFITAAQAIDLRPLGPERLGAGTAAAYHCIREQVAFMERDRELTHDLEALAELIVAGKVIKAVQQAVAGEIWST